MTDLNSIMEIDHVVRVHPNGSVTDAQGIYAPEIVVDVDADGQILPNGDTDMIENARRQGWELMSGYTGQDRYSGPILHSSECVGGGLERDILANPGLYVACVVTCLGESEEDESEPAGWVVARRLDENNSYRDWIDASVIEALDAFRTHSPGNVPADLIAENERRGFAGEAERREREAFDKAWFHYAANLGEKPRWSAGKVYAALRTGSRLYTSKSIAAILAGDESTPSGAWITGSNRPGYLPETEVHAFTEWSDAAEVLTSDMREWADNVDESARDELLATANLADYPDYENTGFGDDEPSTCADVTAVLQDDGPVEGKDFLAYITDPHGHVMAWWIAWSADVTPDEL